MQLLSHDTASQHDLASRQIELVRRVVDYCGLEATARAVRCSPVVLLRIISRQDTRRESVALLEQASLRGDIEQLIIHTARCPRLTN